ncbi:hypothetical protein ASG69_10335 [Rhodococcus sp. Leaf225]|nr:hypothetical protein ASG69_10335 [Rhodococcus sp. Leaf225]KQU46631.1 hypothetical protein ASH03_07365 [Rhodococcus sp. Leaf258]
MAFYPKPKCQQCTATLRALDKLGHDQTAVDITIDSGARGSVMALGYLAPPMAVVDASPHWGGFRDGRVAELVEAATLPADPT